MLKKILIFALLFQYIALLAQYKGTASVTKGAATLTENNLYSCTNGRVTNVGTINSSDGKSWTVPAATNYKNASFPWASNLYNACVGAKYANVNAALSNLKSTDIVTIDNDGELITAYIFADNYFEMYINGIPVGKDNVPYTEFNSNIVQFKVKRPFTIAMLLVDWEENLGLGSELNSGSKYYNGDGGMVAVFKDSNNKIIAVTNNDWKAQTYYTSPIKDLSCPQEQGNLRLTDACNTQASNDGSQYYALHWQKPTDWFLNTYNDTDMPSAKVYTNAEIGVNNKPSYTNFTNVFDDPQNDAQFIWSSNVILDNEVIVRYTVKGTTDLDKAEFKNDDFQIFPNPTDGIIYLKCNQPIIETDIYEISLFDAQGKKVFSSDKFLNNIDLRGFERGVYLLKVGVGNYYLTKKIIVN